MFDWEDVPEGMKEDKMIEVQVWLDVDMDMKVTKSISVGSQITVLKALICADDVSGETQMSDFAIRRKGMDVFLDDEDQLTEDMTELELVPADAEEEQAPPSIPAPQPAPQPAAVFAQPQAAAADVTLDAQAQKAAKQVRDSLNFLSSWPPDAIDWMRSTVAKDGALVVAQTIVRDDFNSQGLKNLNEASKTKAVQLLMDGGFAELVTTSLAKLSQQEPAPVEKPAPPEEKLVPAVSAEKVAEILAAHPSPVYVPPMASDVEPKTTLNIKVAFAFRGQSWIKEFEIEKESSVYDLKTQMTSSGGALQFELYKLGRQVMNTDRIHVDEYFDFVYKGG